MPDEMSLLMRYFLEDGCWLGTEDEVGYRSFFLATMGVLRRGEGGEGRREWGNESDDGLCLERVLLFVHPPSWHGLFSEK